VNLVDSSGWLEYFADGANAEFFAPPIEDTRRIVVPTISLLEVFRRILQQKGENEALRAIALMRQGRIVDLDADLALSAARLGRELGLPLADSVILATAHKFNASVWTQNSDFEGLEGVRYVAKG
jgi:predicted nucleic acid-binding protein